MVLEGMKQNDMDRWQAKETIAVLGAVTHPSEAQILSGLRTGIAIASHDCNLITGATRGVPYAAAIGAKLAGAFVVGISPAANREEHIERYKMPLDCHDVIVYTGMGLEGRNSLNVRSAKGAIFIGGEFGTLGEFSAAWTIGGNVLGVLESVGGISSHIQGIAAQVHSSYGSLVLYDSDPETLASRVCREVQGRCKLRDHADAARANGQAIRDVVERYLEINPTLLAKRQEERGTPR